MPDEDRTGEAARRAFVQRLESLRRAGVSHVKRVVFPVELAPASPVAPPAAPAPPPVDVPVVSSALIAPASPPPSSPSAALESPAMPPKPSSARRTSASSPSKPPSKSPSLFEKPDAAGAARPAAASAAPVDLPDDQRRISLDVIDREVRGCTRCPELVANRTKTVFGVGNIRPRLVFFGEAPGADEDQQGEPFVGRAGQLLDKIIEACTLRREDVYILNVLKCRPPGNRAPLEEETENCRGFFERQLAILRPEFIVCLGASAVKGLLHSAFSIGKMRGRFYDYKGARVVVTYHPAYLLRNPNAKKEVWEDMKMLMREMGLRIPGE